MTDGLNSQGPLKQLNQTRLKLKINVTGQKKIIANFKRFGEEGIKETEKLLKIKSQEITAEAHRGAPVDIGNLKANIVNEKITPLEYIITAKAFYSAYMEFGTGKRVSVPPEFKAMALEFKGKSKGDFKDGLERIRIWCGHVGIPESAAYPIFMSILKKGLEPRPFMYPAYIYGRKTYKKDLEFKFKQLIKKFNNE